jgi:bifunctional oligoribonuclease and PAP phosphatase NrnA
MLERLAAFLDAHERILLTSHENPDGDGLGAAAGLAHYLTALGKQARIVVYPHAAPELNWIGPFESYDPAG